MVYDSRIRHLSKQDFHQLFCRTRDRDKLGRQIRRSSYLSVCLLGLYYLLGSLYVSRESLTPSVSTVSPSEVPLLSYPQTGTSRSLRNRLFLPTPSHKDPLSHRCRFSTLVLSYLLQTTCRPSDPLVTVSIH